MFFDANTTSSNEHATFFTQKVNEADSLYSFTKSEKSQLTKKLLSTHNETNANDCWNIAWHAYAKENRVDLATRSALKISASKGDAIAKLASAEYELSQELKKSLRVVDTCVTIDEGTPLKDQVHRLDNDLRDYFRCHHSGPQAKALIKALDAPFPMANHEKRIAKWQDPLYVPQLIARCQWVDYTRSVVLEMQNKAPALAGPIHQQLLWAQTRGNRLSDEGDSIIDVKGKKVIDFDSTACIGLETAKSVLLSAAPLLSSVTAYYVITWLLCEVHKQFLMGHKNPNKIVLRGMAYERLGELSGAGSHPCTIAKIRKIIPALAGCLFKYRTEERLGEGNFLSYRYERAINGSYSVLIIEMQPLACPGFVTSLPKGGMKFQEQRKAIPVIRPFPFYGKQTNSFSLQLRFQYALVQEMRNRAKEIHHHGGISLDDHLIATLADEAQLCKKMVVPMIDYWVEDHCLSRSKDWLYNLGSRESAARRMIEEAGKYEVEGANAAKKKLEKQRRKIAGIGKR